MKAALISLGSVSSQWTAKAMQKYFEEFDHLHFRNLEININGGKFEILYYGKPIKDYDCMYIKGSFRFAPLLSTLVSVLGDKTFIPFRADSFHIGHDKLLTHLALQKCNIPMPSTYISSSMESAKIILNKLHYPIIMKFPQGTQGKGVMFAESFASASSILDALNVLKQPFIIQEYIETEGVDIRAIVVGDKVIAAMKRKAVKGEKRSNIHAGGIGEKYPIDSHLNEICVRAAQAVGIDICGVDVLESPRGPLVIELNLSPGLQGITAATGVNVAEHIAKYLSDKTKERMNITHLEKSKKVMQGIDVGQSAENKFIVNLDKRGERLLLPEVVSKSSHFKDKDEVEITVSNKKITIKDSGMNGKNS